MFIIIFAPAFNNETTAITLNGYYKLSGMDFDQLMILMDYWKTD